MTAARITPARLVRATLIVALLLVSVPAAASAATLSGPIHGAVDLGDRVPYRVDGRACQRVAVVAVITVGPQKEVLRGDASKPRRTSDGDCAGVAKLPGFRALETTAWKPGDAIDVALESSAGNLPLRFARIEVDQGKPAAGTPEVVPADDQDTAPNDKAVTLDPGDAVALGRVNLRRTDALAVRLCIDGADTSGGPSSFGPFLTPQRAEPPTFISIRQDGPTGPAVVGPIDVASDPQELSRLSTLGFGGCYRLVVLPITGRVQEDAPSLFLVGEQQGRSGAMRVNSIDVNGSAAKAPTLAPPPLRGMETIFDGSSFEGWDMADCELRDGAAVNARADGSNTNIAGCSITYKQPLQDVVLRFRMRREHVLDNAGIYLGPDQEIQLRSVGEYLPGGYFGQFAARWQKLNTFPDWSEIEVIQIGARHVVTVNGRTVTDVMRADGPPEPYSLQLIAQPQWSYRAGAETTFGGEGFPDTTKPSELGAFWFKNVRVLRCAGPRDAVCRQLADARRGQVPVPDSAPPAMPRDCRRSVTVTVPRSASRIRATVDGKRAKTRRRGGRLRVLLGGRVEGDYAVRVSGRDDSGKRFRIRRSVPACD